MLGNQNDDETMFILMAMHLITMARLWRARRRPGDTRTREEKRARPVDRPGRKSSKAEPEWKKSYFWNLCIDPAARDPASVRGREFRTLFRAPFAVVQWMCDLAVEKNWHPVAGRSAFGVESTPMLLKIVSVLWILGHSGSFAGLKSQSGISEQMMGVFFKLFVTKFVELMLDVWVCAPTEADLLESMKEYARLGFPGCCGSVDCTHVGWDRCPKQYSHAHTGSKGRPTLSYQAVCNHVGYCFSVTAGFCGAANDMTIATFDSYIRKVRFTSFFTDYAFELFTFLGTTRVMKGLYLICDGGQ
jgi:Plant transposon protein